MLDHEDMLRFEHDNGASYSTLLLRQQLLIVDWREREIEMERLIAENNELRKLPANFALTRLRAQRDALQSSVNEISHIVLCINLANYDEQNQEDR